MNPTPDSNSLPPPRSAALALRPTHELRLGNLEPTPAGPEIEDDSIDLRELWRMVMRHKWALLTITAFTLLVALVAGLLSTPLYESTVTLQIDKSTNQVVQFEKDDAGDASDALALQTQVELLKSRALAERVIDELKLDPARERGAALAGQRAADPAAVASAVLTAPPLRAASALEVRPAAARPAEAARAAEAGFLASLLNQALQGYERIGKPAVDDQEVLDREEVVNRFMKSVTVTYLRNSRLVQVKVVGPSAERAARTANAMARAFITMNLERKFDAANYAKDFLEEQIRVTKVKLEESERRLNAYAKDNGILSLDDKTNVLNQTFTDFSKAVTEAEQARAKADVMYSEARRNPDSAPQVLESMTIRRFKELKAQLEADYISGLATYKPDFPKMLQTKAQIAEIDTRIRQETTNVLDSLKAQAEAARQQEAIVKARLADTRKEVQSAQDRSVDLNLLRRELDTNRQVYDSLLQRLKQVDVTRGVATNNVSVADEARAPLFPFKPDYLRNALFGLVAGLLLGAVYIFAREHMDDSVKRADEVEAQFGLPLLGVIPQLTKRQLAGSRTVPALQTVEDPRGSFAEAYRSMRTALQFSTSDGAPRQLMVTSSVKGEGKSTTALSLAINFAQLGRQVLLIDADMRNPSVHKALGLPNERGLANYLSGEGSREQLIQPTSVPNLSVLPAGPMPPSPVDLLMGPRLYRLLEKAGEMGYEQVIVDAPPVLGIADAIVLGNQVPAILFAVKAGHTRKSSVRDALRRLRLAGLVPLGAALTQASSQNAHYYGYDTYYGYGYGDKTALPPAADGQQARA